jgi:hypothetical protein
MTLRGSGSTPLPMASAGYSSPPTRLPGSPWPWNPAPPDPARMTLSLVGALALARTGYRARPGLRSCGPDVAADERRLCCIYTSSCCRETTKRITFDACSLSTSRRAILPSSPCSVLLLPQCCVCTRRIINSFGSLRVAGRPSFPGRSNNLSIPRAGCVRPRDR